MNKWRPKDWKVTKYNGEYSYRISTTPEPFTFTEKDGTLVGGNHIQFVQAGQLWEKAFEDGAEAMLEALKPVLKSLLPLNGYDQCFMCANGSIPDENKMHSDTHNVWGSDKPCLYHSDYEVIRRVLGIRESKPMEEGK